MSTVVVELEGGVLTCMINRPERLNALDGSTVAALLSAVEDADENPDVRVVLLTGAGRAFCVGADIGELRDDGTEPESSRLVRRLATVIHRSRLPVLAVINGLCIGGGLELALHCDIRLAARSARFGLPELRLGAMPGLYGSTLCQTVGGSDVAKLLLWTQRQVSSEQALAARLVTGVVDDAALPAEASDVATAIAASPPLAVTATKRVLNAGEPVEGHLALLEESQRALLLRSNDRVEALAAWRAKRPPKFTGT